MRNKSSKSGWVVFFGLVALLVFALYGTGGLDNLLSAWNGGEAKTTGSDDGVFILAKDRPTATPVSTPKPMVEITTIPQPTQTEEITTDNEIGSVFSGYINERDQVREQEIDMLSQLENNAESRISAEAAQQKLDLVRCMEAEITLRGLMLAKGYKDAVVTVQPGSVNIAVVKNSLTDAEIAAMLDMASRETGQAPGNIKIIPVMEE